MRYRGVTHLAFLSGRRRHTRGSRDWSSDVCSSDLLFASRPSCPTRRRCPRGSARVWRRSRRSEERRVGKECRSRGSPYHLKKKGGLGIFWDYTALSFERILGILLISYFV